MSADDELRIPERMAILEAIKPETDKCNSMSRHDINALNFRITQAVLKWHDKSLNSKLLALKEGLRDLDKVTTDGFTYEYGHAIAIDQVTALIDGVIGGDNGLPSNN